MRYTFEENLVIKYSKLVLNFAKYEFCIQKIQIENKILLHISRIGNHLTTRIKLLMTKIKLKFYFFFSGKESNHFIRVRSYFINLIAYSGFHIILYFSFSVNTFLILT